MSKALTQNQEKVYRFMLEYFFQYHRPPSQKTIAEHFGWASPNAASGHVKALEKHGYLSRTDTDAICFSKDVVRNEVLPWTNYADQLERRLSEAGGVLPVRPDDYPAAVEGAL